MITDDEWQAFDRFEVPQPEQEELNAVVESTKEAIVVAPLEEGPAPTTGGARVSAPPLPRRRSIRRGAARRLVRTLPARWPVRALALHDCATADFPGQRVRSFRGCGRDRDAEMADRC